MRLRLFSARLGIWKRWQPNHIAQKEMMTMGDFILALLPGHLTEEHFGTGYPVYLLPLYADGVQLRTIWAMLALRRVFTADGAARKHHVARNAGTSDEAYFTPFWKGARTFYTSASPAFPALTTRHNRPENLEKKNPGRKSTWWIRWARPPDTGC
jgi:hypothetical protein